MSYVDYKDPHAKSLLIKEISNALSAELKHPDQPIVVLNIGTDRSTGDCYGPMVGRLLNRQSKAVYGAPLEVYGHLDEPVHALNLQETVERINGKHANPFIIAVDACLGRADSVGKIQIAAGSIKPGAGVNKDLPSVGDIHLKGIVNVGGFMEYFVLQNTRFQLVMDMAEITAYALCSALHKRNIAKTAAATQS